MIVNRKRYALKGPWFEEDVLTGKCSGIAKNTERE
jgi:hypothetical protein